MSFWKTCQLHVNLHDIYPIPQVNNTHVTRKRKIFEKKKKETLAILISHDVTALHTHKKKKKKKKKKTTSRHLYIHEDREYVQSSVVITLARVLRYTCAKKKIEGLVARMYIYMKEKKLEGRRGSLYRTGVEAC